MSFIYNLPRGLVYTLKTENGKKVSCLDMTRTNVNMVPRGLKGVDQVKVNAGQLQYIADDYRGKVVVIHPTISGKKESELMIDQNKKLLQQNYRYAIRVYSPMYFDHSLLNQYAQEQHLPSGLVFNKETRTLDASKTVLVADPSDKRAPVEGILGWTLPSRYWQHQENAMRHQQKVLDNKAIPKNHGAIQNFCHSRLSRSPNNADRLIK